MGQSRTPRERFEGRGLFPHQYLDFLLHPGRRATLSPETLANRLDLRGDSAVLEVGPGPGYFSLEMARRTPKGTLVLLDIQREMLDRVRSRLVEAGHANFETHLASAEQFPYVDDCFDVVFMVAVLGEVPRPERCCAEASRVLRPGALFSVTEQTGDPDFLTKEEIRSLASGAGFIADKEFGTDENFTISFRKAVSATPAVNSRSGR